jgi:hypothetical protein
MKADARFRGLGKDFWAHVRSLSQTVGYTDRSTGTIKVPTFAKILEGMEDLELSSDHLKHEDEPSDYAKTLIAYFQYRADVLNNQVQHDLLTAEQAEKMFDRLYARIKPKLPLTMNKQKGEKAKPAYLTGMVNMLIEENAEGITFDHDPRRLTTIVRNGMPLRTFARRVDGTFPSTVNPIALWEIKEYYYTTTFGSRVADGVYETLLDGLEMEELFDHEHLKVEHVLIVDAHYTWWKCGRAYLCRMIDMLNMGYVDDIIFGKEVETALPPLVKSWVAAHKQRMATAAALNKAQAGKLL